MKKGIIGIMLLSFLGFNALAFRINKEVEANSNLSKYINTNIEAVFEKEKELAPLYSAEKYVLGINSPLLNEEELGVSTNVKRDYLVRVNGEYYDKSFKVKEGINEIEVRKALMEENTFTPTNEILEKFKIEVKKEDKIEVEVYYEHYENVKMFVDAVYQGTNRSAKFKQFEKEVETNFKNFEKARENNNDYYDKSLDKTIGYKENNTKIIIKMLSAKNKELEKEKKTNINEMIDDIKYLNIAYDFSNVENTDKGNIMRYENFKEKPLKVNGAKHQAFGIEIVNEAKFPQNIYYSNPIEKVLVEYKITDLVYGDIYNYTQVINFFNHQRYKDKFETKIIEKNTNLEVYKEYNEPNYFVEDIETYITLTENSIPLFLAQNKPVLAFITKPNTMSVSSEKQGLKMKFEANYGTSKTKVEIPYTVCDEKAPKVLIKHNVILLDREQATYTEYIRVIDNYTLTPDLEVTYKRIEQDKNGGIIRVSVSDKSGNSTTVEAPFRYKSKISFIRKMMYDYSESVKKMFL